MQLHGLGLKRTSHEARVWKDKSALALLAACVRQHDMSRRGDVLAGMEPMLEKPLLEMAERLIDEGGYLRRAGSARSVGRRAFVGLLVYLARCRIMLQGKKCGVGLIFATSPHTYMFIGDCTCLFRLLWLWRERLGSELRPPTTALY